MEKKTHFYLVAGEIVYKHPSQPDAIGYIRLNSVLQMDRNLIRHRELGKAQQMLQLHFHNRMNDPTFEVVDVFLVGLSYMGHMTEAEFQLPPEGEQVRPAGPTPLAKELN